MCSVGRNYAARLTWVLCVSYRGGLLEHVGEDGAIWATAVHQTLVEVRGVLQDDGVW